MRGPFRNSIPILWWAIVGRSDRDRGLLGDIDLASVRDPEPLGRLSTSEATDWRDLWDRVRAVVR